MRKITYFLTVLSAVCVMALVACKGEQKAPAPVEEKMVVEERDTTAVYGLMEQYLDLLKQERLDDAMDMLHMLTADGRIVDVPEEQKVRQRQTLSPFLGLQYRIDRLVFHKETDSEVKYTVILFEKEKDDPRPNEVSFIVRPMRIDGEWYLTLADMFTDVRPSEIEH